jgi:methyltransferase (TIGR00027 family)
MPDLMDTAAAVAWLRAREGTLPAAERLFDDPFAHLFARGPEECDATKLMVAAPFVHESIRLRTRYIDDAVRAGLQAGLRHILIHGAGFDCRALRMTEITAHAALVFEVDFTAQLARKRDVLTGAGIAIPPYLRMVACDFTRDDYPATLIPALAAAGFAVGGGAMVVIEGVLSYLDPPDIDRALACAAAGGATTRLVFNYPAWRFSHEAMAAHLERAGFHFLDDSDGDQLYRQYLRADPPPGGDFYRVATAARA